MAVRLDLLAQGATSANRAARFPDDEPLEAAASNQLESGGRSKTYEAVLSSSAVAALETSEALGMKAEIDPGLRDLDYGRWRGLSLKDVAASEAEAFAAWLSDPAAVPHGGESIEALIERARTWLAALLHRRGAILAITHPPVLRAAVVCALGAPASAFWRIDAAPLTCARLSGHAGRWNLVALGSWDATP